MTRGTLKLRPGTPPRPVPEPDPAKAARTWFMQAYPLLFNPLRPVPLSIGIRRDLLKLRPKPITDRSVRYALRSWCRSPAYLDALARGGHRYNLQGPAGKVTDEQRERAAETLRKLP